MNKREARKAVRKYFKGEKFRLIFVGTRKGVLADVEYEDFLPEFTVRRELEKLLGEGYLLNVKRECSERLTRKVIDFIASDSQRTKTFQMLLGCYMV